MKREVIMVIVLIALVLAGISFFIFSHKSNPAGNIVKSDDTGDNGGNNIEADGNINGASVGSVGGGGGGGSSGAAGSSQGGVQDNGKNKDSKNLPSDINSVECGYYFSEFEVCAGTCPEGICVNEGRSCYCKK